ncbi:MAG TPA: DUF308 domain-containing protein [Rhizomicrobium sp.]|jgi:uncharacterized membrane protein HdeD (DUF308 family)
MQLSIAGQRPGKFSTQLPSPKSAAGWLRNYYLTRAVVSAAWIAGVVTVARGNHQIAGLLLIAYPAWDAVANYFDAESNGGLNRNPTQILNLVVSIITVAAVAIALKFSMNAVIGVFAVWAVLAGVLQLATAVRRWKAYGAQWVMVLSGAQSALAGAFMATVAIGAHGPDITAIAPYAGFGAFYFLLSAIWLTVSNARHRITPPNNSAA